MNESLGSTVIIVIIVVFITLVSGYLAFNINYTKASKMKNKMVDLYEKYKGDCSNGVSKCYNEIENYAKEIGYNTEEFKCEKGSTLGDKGKYCVEEIHVVSDNNENDKVSGDLCDRVYYKITTKPETPKIPVFYYFFSGLRYFSISGDTKIICKD